MDDTDWDVDQEYPRPEQKVKEIQDVVTDEEEECREVVVEYQRDVEEEVVGDADE